MLLPRWSHGILEERVQVAQAAFPGGNKLTTLRDALGLELNDSGFQYFVLTEFRQRLIGHQATQLLLERILER